MRDKSRCWAHGGKSTGPRTPEGRARIAESKTKHGGRSKETTEMMKRARELLLHTRKMLLET